MTIETGAQALAADVLKLVSKSKIITATRVATADSGDVIYAGVGFKPRAVICLAGAGGGNHHSASIGFGDENLAEGCLYHINDSAEWHTTTVFIYLGIVAGNSQSAVVKTLDADGFTLTWTESGTGTTYDGELVFLCLGQAGEL